MKNKRSEIQNRFRDETDMKIPVFELSLNSHFSLMRGLIFIPAIAGAIISFILFDNLYPQVLDYFPGIEEKERIPAILFTGAMTLSMLSWWPLYFINKRCIKKDDPGFPWLFFILIHGMFLMTVILLLIESIDKAG